MSSEEESFAGYSSPELSPAEKRSQTLGAVICQLANDWDIVPESPEKLATSESREKSVNQCLRNENFIDIDEIMEK